jgi:hypothetical protein
MHMMLWPYTMAKALNFEHTRRFLLKTLEHSCEKEKKHAIQEQA